MNMKHLPIFKRSTNNETLPFTGPCLSLSARLHPHRFAPPSCSPSSEVVPVA